MLKRIPLQATVAACLVYACVSTTGASDDATHVKMTEARQAALRVHLDGDAADWEGIPVLTDAAPTPTGNPAMDIEAAAIAPLDSELLIMLRTRRPPLKLDHLYRINLDYRGDSNADIQIALSFKGNHAVWPNHDEKDPRYVMMRGVAAKHGDVIEASITYEDLAKVLPPDKAADLMGAAARGWVRVRPFTMRLRGATVIDWGPAAASYRLTATPPLLDPPMPMKHDGEPHAIDMPGDGRWYVSQGADGRHTHRGTWAYDMIKVDRSLSPVKANPDVKENHYVWDAPILAPIDGKVAAVRDDGVDHEPNDKQTGRTNTLILHGDGGAAVVFYHLRQNSATVKQGDAVKAGDALARVGNSGGTNYPHLHLQVGVAGRGVPLAFRNVRVSLNPVDDCPWARDLDTWSPREGFLVEPAPKRDTRVPR